MRETHGWWTDNHVHPAQSVLLDPSIGGQDRLTEVVFRRVRGGELLVRYGEILPTKPSKINDLQLSLNELV